MKSLKLVMDLFLIKDNLILSIFSNIGDKWDNGIEVLEVHRSVHEKT